MDKQKMKKKFAFLYAVTRCSGWQRFIIEAYDLEDAKQRMENGEGDFDDEDVEIIASDKEPTIHSEDGIWLNQ